MALLIIFIYALMAFITSIFLRVLDLRNGVPESRSSGLYFACGVVWPFSIFMVFIVFMIKIIEHISDQIYDAMEKDEL